MNVQENNKEFLFLFFKCEDSKDIVKSSRVHLKNCPSLIKKKKKRILVHNIFVKILLELRYKILFTF